MTPFLNITGLFIGAIFLLVFIYIAARLVGRAMLRTWKEFEERKDDHNA